MSSTPHTNSPFEPLSRDDIEATDALSRIFSLPRLRRAFRRIVRRDSEDTVTHPIKKPLLVEFEDTLCKQLAEAVPSGTWKTGGAYLFLTNKRSGLFRELVFPTLVDSLVGRCLIDSLEHEITKDDDNKTFAGRSHFGNNRAPGDYTSWFKVWRDFTAAVDQAAESEGFAYVFESDVSDFFPSVDRSRAIEMVAQRTGAHQSVLSLLRYCLESWLPRFEYSAMTGLPVDCLDVSRLVAHNYLKGVDAAFKDRSDCIYLRYVDDTVMFVPTDAEAAKVKRSHHLKLREYGLNPSPSKTRIVTTSDYQESRHREANAHLEYAREHRDEEVLSDVVKEWYSRKRSETESWDKVARHAYGVAKQLRSETMRRFVVDDVQESPDVAVKALDYLCSLDISVDEAVGLAHCASMSDLELEVQLAVARAFADGRFPAAYAARIADIAGERSGSSRSETPGVGYVQSVWLLALFKYGNFKQRGNGLRRVTNDAQWRLHFALVWMAHWNREARRELSVSALETSDHQLLLRMCLKAMRGSLNRPRQTLDSCVTRVHGSRGIAAKHLPLVTIIMNGDHYRPMKERWLHALVEAKGRQRVRDGIVRGHLQRWLTKVAA